MPFLALDHQGRLNRELPCPPDDGRNLWLIKAARKLQLWRCKPESAARILADLLTRPDKGGEVAHAISTAYSTAYNGACGVSVTRKEPAPLFNPEALERLAERVPFNVTTEWLAKQSLVSARNVTPSMFLDAIYKLGELAV